MSRLYNRITFLFGWFWQKKKKFKLDKNRIFCLSLVPERAPVTFAPSPQARQPSWLVFNYLCGVPGVAASSWTSSYLAEFTCANDSVRGCVCVRALWCCYKGTNQNPKPSHFFGGSFQPPPPPQSLNLSIVNLYLVSISHRTRLSFELLPLCLCAVRAIYVRMMETQASVYILSAPMSTIATVAGSSPAAAAATHPYYKRVVSLGW